MSGLRKRLSLITVCYNSAKTIEDTIKSVISQSCFETVEYIIIDGQSKDETLAVISKYEGLISKLISEPDKGIYDAMNKGIALASGEVIAFLNSDDFFTDNFSLERILQPFENSEVVISFGDVDYVDPKDVAHIARNWKTGAFRKSRLQFGWMPAHPAFYARSSLFKAFGNFDPSLRIAADYDLMTRFLSKIKENEAKYVQSKIVKMRLGGESNRDGLKTILRAGRECAIAAQRNGTSFPRFAAVAKVIRKLPQYL